MNCPRCTAPNPDAAKFCRECGAPLTVPCAACGHAEGAGSRFCTECGEPLQAAPSRFGAPVTYTPEHLAGRIRTSGAALEGERKQVTVLFADLKSSMELLADRDPEEARSILDPVLERMMEAVHRYEGTVNQVMGDGIMALFGAPLAHEDHAVRACYAALRMLESIERYAEETRRTFGVPVQIRVGLNSGEVVVRSIGNDLKMDYTAVGQSTHLAARMEGLARPGAIYLSGETARLAEGFIETRPLGPLAVKGLAAPVEVHELIGRGPVRSRMHAAAARGLSRFVGRDSEVAELARAGERAAEGAGQLVAVVGEPGVGKSRLLWEFVRSSETAGWLILQSAALPYATSTPYLPIIELLRDYFGIAERDAPETVAAKVALAVGPEEPARFVSPLLALLDAPVHDAHWHDLEPGQRRRRTVDAVKHLLVRRGQAQPICAVVEDLHWLDAESQAVLDSLAGALPAARLLLLVSYRPEYRHDWGGRSSYLQIRVDPLRQDSAAVLLHDIVGNASELQPLHSLLIERTEGNPFFLEESVRNLVETGVLAGERGAYRLAGTPEHGPVPATVQAVLAARIDRLRPDDKRLLQAASAVGKDVPLPILKSVAELTEDDLTRCLARLQAGEFLYEVRVFPEIEYTFKHALTLEVAFGSLLRERRHALDARIVEAIERLHPDRNVEQLDRLAHHALRGEVWEKAFTYCREAGRRAFARSAHRAAVSYFDHALGALAHRPESRATVEAAIDVRLELRNALSPLGEYRRMLESLTEAQKLAERLGDERRAGLVAAFLTNFFTLRGELDRALEHGERALQSATHAHDLSVSVLTHAFLGLAYFGKGEYRRAVDHAGRNVEALAGDHAQGRFGMALLPAVYSRTVMVWSLAELGEFTAAWTIAEEARRIAETADHAHSLIFAALGLGTVHLRRGDMDEAVRVLERAHALWQLSDLPAVLLELASPLASAYALSGRAADAITLLEEAVAQAVALHHRYGHWLRTGGLAEAYLCAGRVEEALPLAQAFVELTRLVNARGSQAMALRLLGDVAAHRDPPDAAEAERALRGALAIAEELGMRPLQARCRFTLGELFRHAGDREGAQAELTAAAEAFGTLGMMAWARRAEDALAALR